jgi:hypothetical protein
MAAMEGHGGHRAPLLDYVPLQCPLDARRSGLQFRSYVLSVSGKIRRMGDLDADVDRMRVLLVAAQWLRARRGEYMPPEQVPNGRVAPMDTTSYSRAAACVAKGLGRLVAPPSPMKFACLGPKLFLSHPAESSRSSVDNFRSRDEAGLQWTWYCWNMGTRKRDPGEESQAEHSMFHVKQESQG